MIQLRDRYIPEQLTIDDIKECYNWLSTKKCDIKYFIEYNSSWVKEPVDQTVYIRDNNASTS